MYTFAEIPTLQDKLYLIGGKWRIPIINSLCNGNMRFREIERSIPGITTTMLSKELKDMELNKLLIRKVYPDIPILIAYRPTEYSRIFGEIIQEMICWGREHRKKVIEE